MKSSELLTKLNAVGAHLWVEGSELKISAPKGALTAELVEELKANKRDLIAMLAPPDETEPVEIPLVPRDAPLPLSSTQERLWFLDQLEPGLTAYNMWVGALIRGPLDRAALERALAAIVERHEVLRASYAAGEAGGAPTQTFAAAPTVAFDPVTNASGLDRDAWFDEAKRLLVDRCREPYDLATGPLYRIETAEIAEGEFLLVFGCHHSVADGWSMAVFLDDLHALYTAFAHGEEAPLDPLPVQYGDFAAWQREFMAGPEFARQRDYWRERLSGELPVLEFPTDRPRPPIQTYGGDNVRHPVALETLDALTKLAQREGATLFMALLALYETLILRTTGQTDVLVGTPIANRNNAALAGLMGFFSNTLVIRTDLSDDPTFREVLRRVRDRCLEAYENQDMPFEKLVEELAPDRSMAYTPVFQTLFLLEEGRSDDVQVAEVEFDYLDLKANIARTDLTFGLFRNPERAIIWAEYRTDLFDESTAARLCASYHALLEGALADPDAPLSRLPMMDDAQRALLVHDWNATASAYPHDSSIVAEFEARAAETPDAIAAVFASVEEGRRAADAPRLSYRELNERANRIAHRLIELGVEADTLVGISTERDLSMLAGILGILKAGGAYVPLDPGYPEERLRFMIEDAGLDTILVQDALLGSLPAQGATLIGLDDASFAERPTTNPASRSGARNLAYVMFTSGSTGRPKGVCVEQRSVLRLVMDPNFCVLGPDHVLLHFAPISFDASTLEVWGALLRGGRMVVYPPVDPSLEDLGFVLREYGVTTAWLTAGLFSLMVEHQLDALAGLKQLLAGGDVLPVPQVNRVLREAPGVRLVNGYGPTEGTTFTCCHQISDGGPVEGSVPIGKPVSDTRVYIVDEHMQPVPIGVPGELFIGGHGVARGYLKRPELTAERFVVDPFSDEAGARLYAVGDRARWRADGTVEFLGRTDGQVKVRGFRIELGEIESVLGAKDGVREVSVIVREDQPGDKRIVAYVVPEKSDAAPSSTDLRSYLKDRLPAYMTPAHFVTLDALPLSPNGKVDRRALPSPDASQDVDTPYAAPRNEVERELAEIWQEVLGVERVGVHDNFFDLGGNSLLSTQAMTRIRKRFDVDLPLRVLFLDPTIAGLAKRVGSDGADEVAGRAYEEVFDKCLIPLQPRGWKRPLFIVSGAHAHEDDFLRFVGAILPHMSKEQPIYGFKARGLDGVSPPHESAEEMAADYLTEMRELQPEGPYLLAGNCVGGIVAFEMARQLREQDEEVALVALLDTTAPVKSYQEFVAHHYRFWRLDRFTNHLRRMSDLSLGEKVDYVVSRFGRKARRIAPMSEADRRRKHVETVERRYSQILAHYQPKPFDGKVTLVINEDFQREMPDAGWSEYVEGELEIHVVEGDHVTRLLENAGPTAALLEDCIARALARDAVARSKTG